MVSYYYKTIFVHITKAGGTSVEKILWPFRIQRNRFTLYGNRIDGISNKYQTGGMQHLKWFQIKKEVGDKRWNQYYKFAIVRNPYTRAISQYEYAKKRKDLLKLLKIDENIDFGSFLKRIRNSSHVQYFKQVDFIYDNKNKLMVDEIIKLENLNEKINELFKKLKVKKYYIFKNPVVPHLNKTVKKNYSFYLTDENKSLIADIYNDDFNLLKYDK